MQNPSSTFVGMEVLVVEDEDVVRERVMAILSDNGFAPSASLDKDQILEYANSGRFSALILDLGLPGFDGISVVRAIRESSDLPILILTGRAGVHHRVSGLEAGADDYVVKPFSADELIARVRALLRRSRPSGVIQAPVVAIEIASATVDLIGREMSGPRGMVRLTDREARLILALARAQGLLSRQAIYREAYLREWDPNDRSIDVHVTNLRKKFETICGVKNVISSIRGRGYQLRFGSKLISSED